MGFLPHLFSECVDSSLLCTVCWEVLEDPVFGACGHAYCGKCIASWLKLGNKLCPHYFHCLTECTTFTPICGTLRKTLDTLILQCPFGCGLQFRLGGLQDHAQRCPWNTAQRRLSAALEKLNHKLWDLSQSSHNWLASVDFPVEEPKKLRTAGDMHPAILPNNGHLSCDQIQPVFVDTSIEVKKTMRKRNQSMKALVDELTENGHIRVFRISYVMSNIDRQFYVEYNPYDDEWQTSPVLVRPPRDDALILETLTYHLLPGAKVLKIGCVSNFLTVCLCVMVGNLGHILCYDNSRYKLRRFMNSVMQERPTLLETKNMEAHLVRSLQSLLFFTESFDVIVVEKEIVQDRGLLFGALKPGGRMIAVNRTERTRWEVHDKLQNGRIRSNVGMFK